MPITQGSKPDHRLRRALLYGTRNDRPVIIGGCPRSGTTLVSEMLSAHDDFAIPPETRFVVESFQRRVKFGNLRDPANRRAVGEWIVGTKKTRFPDMDLDPRRVVERVAAAPPTIGSLSGAVLEEFARQRGARRWGDKRPKHVQHLGLIFRLYPDAQFIHVIRDARGATASLKKLGWWGFEAPDAVALWQRAVSCGIRARERYRADQYLEVRYEDLVTDPEPQLRRIAMFLGIDFTDSMLKHHETGTQLIDKPYHDRLYQPVDTAAMDKWRDVLEPEELALIEKKVGHLLDEFGYTRLDGLPEVPAALEERYAARRSKREGSARKGSEREQKREEAYSHPVAARLTSQQRRMYWVRRLARRR